jgi:hypothetical protein
MAVESRRLVRAGRKPSVASHHLLDSSHVGNVRPVLGTLVETRCSEPFLGRSLGHVPRLTSCFPRCWRALKVEGADKSN